MGHILINFTLIIGHQISITISFFLSALHPSWLIHVSWNTIFVFRNYLDYLLTHSFTAEMSLEMFMFIQLKHIHLFPTGEMILNDVMHWKRFPHYWTLVRGIHRWPVVSPNQYPVSGTLWVIIVVVSLEKPLDMQSRFHDDVIKWKHFPRNWPFVRGIHRSRWIPHTKASDAELWCFLWSASE